MSNTTSSLIILTCLVFVLTGCQPVDVSMTVVTKGASSDTFTIKNTSLKAIQNDVTGIYGKVTSSKEIGYIKGEGVLFDCMIEIDGKQYPAKLVRDVQMKWDRNKAPVESVNGPSPGEIVLVVSVNGIYYDNITVIKITSPTK